MTLSNGKERPINPGTDEEAYQQNRNGQTIITSGAY
jgi:peptidoglycan-associated lipoprotein